MNGARGYGKPLAHHCAAISAIVRIVLGTFERYCGSSMRRLMLLIAVGAALAGQATPLLAFQEQWVGGNPPGKAAIGPPSLQMPSLELSVSDAAAGKGAGIEVRIPGVGSVGALPKL